MSKKVSLTAQNRLIISGLLISTIVIVIVALFAILNIQKILKEGYQGFGQGISGTLAIESVELIKGLPQEEVKGTLDFHSNLLIKGHKDIVFVEFRDIDGNIISSTKQLDDKDRAIKPAVTVSSPLIIPNDSKIYGSVTVGLSGSIV